LVNFCLAAEPAPQADAAEENKKEQPPGDAPGAPKEEPQADPLAGFVKPAELLIVYVYDVYDAETGKFLRQECPGESKLVNVKEYEEKHGQFSEADWLDYTQLGFIKIYIDTCDGWL
jgi:hypothetical protein